MAMIEMLTVNTLHKMKTNHVKKTATKAGWHAALYMLLLLLTTGCTNGQNKNEMKYEISKTPEEWKAELTSEEYHILREKGTERAFSGDLWDNKKEGTYTCAACGQALFSSETKYTSGTGWPSFFKPLEKSSVAIEEDRSLGMVREEVLCSRCGGHLGHVFPDGPEPTGLRYCLNSAALDFEPED